MKVGQPLSEEARLHLEGLLDNSDPTIRRWAESLLDGHCGPATKSASGASSGLRAYVAKLASSDPDPAVRARAEGVLDRIRRAEAPR